MGLQELPEDDERHDTSEIAVYQSPVDLPWRSWESILRKWPDLVAWNTNDDLDALIQEILQVPVTSLSQKINGLDDRPLGVSMAMKYQRRGELSLWDDCLLHLVPAPLASRSSHRLTGVVSAWSPDSQDDVHIEPDQRCRPHGLATSSDTLCRRSTASSVYSRDEDSQPYWKQNSSLLPILLSSPESLSHYSLQGQSDCSPTALPTIEESRRSIPTLIEGVDADDDKSLGASANQPLISSLSTTLPYDVSTEAEGPGTTIGPSLSRSARTSRSHRAAKAKAARDRFACLDIVRYYATTGEGSPTLNEGPFPSTSTRATSKRLDPRTKAATSRRLPPAELYARSPPVFTIASETKTRHESEGSDPFCPSEIPPKSSVLVSTGEAQRVPHTWRLVENGSHVESGPAQKDSREQDSLRPKSTNPSPPPLPLSKYNLDVISAQKMCNSLKSSPTLSNDNYSDLDDFSDKELLPTTETGLQVWKPLPELPLPSAAASAAMDQSAIHPAQREYPGFLTSRTDEAIVDDLAAEEDKPSRKGASPLRDPNFKSLHVKISRQDHYPLKNSWAKPLSVDQNSGKSQPSSSTSAATNRLLTVLNQAVPGTPSTSTESVHPPAKENHERQLLSLRSILLEDPPSMPRIKPQTPESHTNHDAYLQLASQKSLYRRRGKIDRTTISLPLERTPRLAPLQKSSPSQQTPHHSARSAPLPVISPISPQYSTVTDQPIPGTLIPAYNGRSPGLSNERKWHGALSAPLANTNLGPRVASAMAAIKTKGSLISLRPSEASLGSPIKLKVKELRKRMSSD